MGLTGLRRISAIGLVLALNACGGRALIDDGAAAGGQSGALATAGQAAGGGSVTTPQGGGPVFSSGGSSPTMPVCREICESILCIGGDVVTPPGQCCPVCAVAAIDAGVASPTNQCPGQAANPPPSCPLTPADVACSSDSDCTTRMAPVCNGCLGQRYGVNRTGTALCGPTACPPIGANCLTVSFETQDCRVSPSAQAIIGAKCVAGECFSFAENPP
jgi:hypothetical protein